MQSNDDKQKQTKQSENVIDRTRSDILTKLEVRSALLMNA